MQIRVFILILKSERQGRMCVLALVLDHILMIIAEHCELKQAARQEGAASKV